MSAGLAISALIPSVTTGAIFSSRRASSGIDNMSSDNPYVGLMNMDIAAGQITNAAKSTFDIARCSSNAVANGLVSAEESIRNLSNANKVASGLSKVIKFTADNINPLICLTGGIKVACADDKADEAGRESLALGAMFASEATARKVLGMPVKKVNKDGKKQFVTQEGLYRKNPFLKKQSEALVEYCSTKTFMNHSLKFVPGTLKGVGFALASIFGYKAGHKAAEMILGERKSNQAA